MGVLYLGVKEIVKEIVAAAVEFLYLGSPVSSRSFQQLHCTREVYPCPNFQLSHHLVLLVCVAVLGYFREHDYEIDALWWSEQRPVRVTLPKQELLLARMGMHLDASVAHE